MSGELENMKRLEKVEVKRITDHILQLSPLKLVMEVFYSIVADDGTVMYQEKFTRDVSGMPGIGNKTLAERLAYAQAEAVKDAKMKYGK